MAHLIHTPQLFVISRNQYNHRVAAVCETFFDKELVRFLTVTKQRQKGLKDATASLRLSLMPKEISSEG
jgi:hypothetical protein